jgi:hypothetical protein
MTVPGAINVIGELAQHGGGCGHRAGHGDGGTLSRRRRPIHH